MKNEFEKIRGELSTKDVELYTGGNVVDIKNGEEYYRDLEKREIVDVFVNFLDDLQKEQYQIKDEKDFPSEIDSNEKEVGKVYSEPDMTASDVRLVINAIKDLAEDEKNGIVKIDEHFHGSTERANKLYMALVNFKYKDFILERLKIFYDILKEAEENNEFEYEKIKPLLKNDFFDKSEFTIKIDEQTKTEIEFLKNKLGLNEAFFHQLFSSDKFYSKLHAAWNLVNANMGAEHGSVVFYDYKTHDFHIPDPINGPDPYSTSLNQLGSIYNKEFALMNFHFHPEMGVNDQIIVPSEGDLLFNYEVRHNNGNEIGIDYPPICVIVQRITSQDYEKTQQLKMLMIQEPLSFSPAKIIGIRKPLNQLLELNYDRGGTQESVLNALRTEGYKCYVAKTIDGKLTNIDLANISRIFANFER